MWLDPTITANTLVAKHRYISYLNKIALIFVLAIRRR